MGQHGPWEGRLDGDADPGLLRRKADPTQLIYYQAGIGTYGGRSQLKGGISAVLDQAVGSGLGEHIRQGYRCARDTLALLRTPLTRECSFLMQNYQAGDKISLFGFSRGACELLTRSVLEVMRNLTGIECQTPRGVLLGCCTKWDCCLAITISRSRGCFPPSLLLNRSTNYSHFKLRLRDV